MLCDSIEQKLLYSGYLYGKEEFSYRECLNCGLLFCAPFPTQAFLNKFYQKSYNYSWFSKRKRLKKLQAWHRTKRIRKFIQPNAKTLDVGCGHGYFVEELEKIGFDAYGFDVGKKAASGSNSNKLFYGISLEEIPFNDFDFISAWHSLEHMLNPIGELKILRGKLKEGGKLLAAVPNYNCLGQRIKKKNWVWLQEPYVHLWHFNSSNVQLLFEHAGFSVEQVWTQDTWDAQIYDWGLSYMISILKLISGQREKEWFYPEEFLRLLTTPISYALNPLYKLFGIGSELIILASKSSEERGL